MCGIAGVVRWDGGVDQARARAMAEGLAHRGPDRIASWRSPDGRCALGHSRLSVIDLETGHQPMANESGSVQVVFNGEIYNFRELRAELETRGHAFRSRSDTEVLVHGWEEWGTDLATHLVGMFAFGIWDDEAKRLHLARDRPGKKPLYYRRVAEGLVFASEAGVVEDAAEGVSKGIDPAAVMRYLAYGVVPQPGSIYVGVEQVPPASHLTVTERDPGRPVLYDALEFSSGPPGSRHSRIGEVRSATTRSVRRRLVADVPLGAYLSGGVDSTVVVAVMSQLLDRPFPTFSFAFQGAPAFDERRWARSVAERFGTEHHEIVRGPESVHEVESALASLDEPFGDSSILPAWILAREARRRVTVVLSGDGGDELFGGYWRLKAAAAAERIPFPVRRLAGKLAPRVPGRTRVRSRGRALSRFLEGVGEPLTGRILTWLEFHYRTLSELAHPEHLETREGEWLLEPLLQQLPPPSATSSHLARVLQMNYGTYLPDDLLVKADRTSMAHGLEVRSPLLDRDLAEVAAVLPDSLRYRGRRTKVALREAFTDSIPPNVERRGKAGFGVPLSSWFRGPWKSFLYDHLYDDEAPLWDWVRRERVRALAASHEAAQEDHAHRLWALLALDLFLRRWRS